MKDVMHWPQVLAVSLKRFSFDPRTLVASKLADFIQFNERWQVRPGIWYNLAGIVEHQGGGKGGHYIAYVCAADGLWYLCNDSAAPRVRPVATVLHQQAYMLMYTREV